MNFDQARTSPATGWNALGTTPSAQTRTPPPACAASSRGKNTGHSCLEYSLLMLFMVNILAKIMRKKTPINIYKLGTTGESQDQVELTPKKWSRFLRGDIKSELQTCCETATSSTPDTGSTGPAWAPENSSHKKGNVHICAQIYIYI